MAHKSLACSAGIHRSRHHPARGAPARLPAAAASVQAAARTPPRTFMAQRTSPSQGDQDRASRLGQSGATSQLLTCLWLGFECFGKSYSLGTETSDVRKRQNRHPINSEEVLMQEHSPARVKDFASLRQLSNLPSCHTRVPLELARAPDTREGAEGERAGLALVTPNRRFKDKLRNRHPVGRSVGRLGAQRAHSSAGTLLTPQRRHMRGTPGSCCCCRSWRSFDSRHCCPGDGPSVPRSTKEPALTR